MIGKYSFMSVSAKHSKSSPRRVSRWVKLISWGLSLGLLLLFGIALGLQTRWAKTWIVQILNERLAQGSVRIEVEGLTGTLPHQPRLASLRVSDANGCWLEARDVSVDWRPQQWLRGKIDIRCLDAVELKAHRRPQAAASGTGVHSPVALSLPQIQIHDLHCDTLDLQAGVVTDRAYHLSLSGSAQTMERRSQLQTSLKITGDIEAQVQANLQRSSATPLPYEVQLELTLNDQAYQLTSTCDLNDQALILNDLQIEWPFLIANGDLYWDRQQARPRGELSVQIRDLSTPASWFKRDIQGHGTLALTFITEQGSNLVLGHWQIEDLQTLGTLVERAEGDFVWSLDSLRLPQALKAQVQGINFKKYRCEQVQLTLDHESPQISLALTAKGHIDRPFTLDTHVILPRDSGDSIAQIDHLNLQWGDDALQLQCPAVLWHQDISVHWKDWQWIGDPYRVSLNGEVTKQRLDVTAILANLQVDQLPKLADCGLEGNVTGQVHISGPLTAPCIESETRISGLRPADPSLGAEHALDAILTGSLSHHLLQGHLDLSTPNQDLIALDFTNPMTFSLYPWTWDRPEDQQQLVAQVDSDIEVLDWFPVFREVLVSGRIQGKVQHHGPWDQRHVNGEIRWVDGGFEDVLLGTVVRDIQMTCRLKEGEEVTVTASGLAGDQGRVNGRGTLRMQPQEGLPYHLDVTASHVPWIQRPDVAVEASGQVALSGTVTQMKVNGQMTLDKGHLYLDALAPALPQVLIEKPSNHAITDANASNAFVLSGGIDLDLDESFAVSGRGLQSVWDGHLQLAQQDSTWQVLGEITSVHGDFRLLGRPFRLESSTVRLDGSSPIDPILDVTTSHQRSSIEAIIEITGRSSNPTLSISSDPTLPEDAVLAAVLFGKDLDSISPWQALQLATTVRNLQSPSQSIDLFQTTRRLAQVDYLDIQKQDDDSDDLSLAVGKYIRPDVYVEVQRTLNNQGVTTTRVEYEIQPNLTVETDVGVGIQPGLGINWKRDY